MASSGEANVSDDAYQPPARNQNPEAVPPDLIQLVMEAVVVFNQTQLVGVRGILFKSPVRRGG
jgi:hypothetical protein